MTPNIGGQTVPRIVKSEHIGPGDTGDNIMAKRVAMYGWDGSNWQRQGMPFFSSSYDEVLVTYTDSSKTTISKIESKLNGVVQQTITYSSGTTTDDFVRT